MNNLRWLDLQLFADSEETDPDPVDQDENDDAGEGDKNDQSHLTQADLDRVVESRLARERKRLAKTLGVTKLEDASQYLQVGQAVAKASGLSPKEVAARLAGYQPAGTPTHPRMVPGQSTQYDPTTTQKLERIESLLEEERSEKLLSTQEAEARKEFDKLYDTHKDDIQDKAEEMGLSLIDAATIVLRPHLKEHLATQQREKQRVQGRRKVEGSSESPGGGAGDAAARLSSAQQSTAKRFGISYDAYYNQLKRRGKID